MNAPATPSVKDADPVNREVAVFLAVVAVLALGLALLTWFIRRPGAPPIPEPIPTATRRLVDFSLVNWDGRKVTRADVAGKFLVVSFLSTSCSATCTEVNRRLEQVQTANAGANDLRLLSLSTDPRTDQPPALAQFARRWNADPQRWFILTGEKEALHRLIETSFLTRDPALADQPGAGFRHHYAIALVDRSGAVRHHFNGLAPTVTADVLDALNELRKENSGSR